MKIISIFGYSNAGKGTVAAMLCMLDDRFHHSKFARPMKVELERQYGLSEGMLEHRSMKGQLCEPGVTYLDKMVALYHQRSRYHMLPRSTNRLVSHCMLYGLIPVFDDCRNLREGALLVENDTFGLWVDRRSAKPISSDDGQGDIYDSLLYKARLQNDGGLPLLMKDVEALYYSPKLQAWLNS